jgi:hypothetical protein
MTHVYTAHQPYVSSRIKYSLNELFIRLPWQLFNYSINYLFNTIALIILFS